MVAPQRLSDESALQVADPRRAQVPALSKQLTSLHQVYIPQYCVPADAYDAMSSISTHAPAADAASATTASDRIVAACSPPMVSSCGSALRQLRWVGNPLINAAPNPNKNVQAFKRSEAVPRDLARGTSFF